MGITDDWTRKDSRWGSSASRAPFSCREPEAGRRKRTHTEAKVWRRASKDGRVERRKVISGKGEDEAWPT